MSHDITGAVGDSQSAFGRVCHGVALPDLRQAAQSLHPSLSQPIVLLTLLIGFLGSLLGYVAFLALIRQEEQQQEGKEQESWDMQDAAGGATKSSGTHRRMLSGLGMTASRQAAPQQVAVEYEDDSPPAVPTPTQTVASSTPGPPTPSAFSQHAAKAVSDSEDGNPTKPDHTTAGFTNLTHGAGDSFHSLAAKVDERGPLTAEVTDGNNNYVWDDNSEYFGEWEGCQAHGRGVFSWPNSDRYEGEWRNGLENGVGTFIAADGSTAYGPWSAGKMHGQVMYQPAVGGNQEPDIVYMREYRRGDLMKETKLRGKDYDYLRRELKRDQRARRVEKRQAAKEMMTPPRPGETIYKGHRSYNLMRSLQQGISFSVASVDKQVGSREPVIRSSDFKKEVVQHIPSSGEFPPFKWKDYSPYIFHCLREAFGIDNRDYLISITNRNTLRELPSPGKSGSVFFISDDERFMIKTVRKEEMHLLIDLIPKYYKHCVDNPDTLLTRFYGVHRIKPISGPQVRFVVMGNVFPTETKMDRRFDLKGSSHGRTAGPKKDGPNVILKDLDVDFRLQLKDELYKKLMKQIQADAALLERMHVMDYSLLLGIHYTEDPDAASLPAGKISQRNSLATEGGDSPTAESQQVPWSREFAAAEIDASKFSHQEPIFTTWRSQRHLEVDEPSPPRIASNASNRGPESEREAESLNHRNEPAASDVSSLTSASLFSTLNSYPSQAGMLETRDLRPPNTAQGSPFSSPQRLSRFGLESQGNAATPPANNGNSQQEPADVMNPFEQASIPNGVKAAAVSRDTSDLPESRRSSAFANDAASQEDESVSIQSKARSIPRFLQLINRLSTRDDLVPAASGLERTRSGWIKAPEEFTSLRSLHVAQTPHMGVSIPAVSYRLRADGSADTDNKPQPVTLFFGIIDFLQLYNLRKWSEHQVKSIVQDGKKISVTNPKAYARRFTRHMQTLFIPIPGQ